MPAAKLTSRTVAAAKPAATLFIIYDTELPGFGLRVMPSGFKSWIVEYRPKGSGRSAGKRRLALGPATVMTAVQARRFAKDTLAGVRQGHDPIAERRTERAAIAVRDLADRFLAEHVDRKRKPSTASLYRGALELHVLPRIGTKKAGNVTRSDVLKLHSDLSAIRSPEAGKAGTSKKATKKVGGPVIANRAVAVVGSLYAWAGRAGLVPEGVNPAVGIEKNAETGRERFLSTDELERLGKALHQAETEGVPWVVDEGKPGAKHLPSIYRRQTAIAPHAVAALRLLILTGCRLREILNLRWQEVDFERGMLHLPDSKTGRKSVVLNAPALMVLDAIPRVGSFVIAGRAPKKESAPERPRSDLKKPWNAIRRVAGLGTLRIHDLRHSFASVGAGSGLGLPIIGKLLGHTQASTTQKYAHLDNDPLRRATNAIGATIAAALAGQVKGEVTPISSKVRRVQESRG